MRSVGIVRKVDELGRIVIPKELRDSLKIKEKDSIEIFVENENIILKKFTSAMACRVTGEITNENKKYGNGNIILSPKGAQLLLEEIKKHI